MEFDYKTVVGITDEGDTKVISCAEDGAVIEARTVILAIGTVP